MILCGAAAALQVDGFGLLGGPYTDPFNRTGAKAQGGTELLTGTVNWFTDAAMKATAEKVAETAAKDALKGQPSGTTAIVETEFVSYSDLTPARDSQLTPQASRIVRVSVGKTLDDSVAETQGSDPISRGWTIDRDDVVVTASILAGYTVYVDPIDGTVIVKVKRSELVAAQKRVMAALRAKATQSGTSAVVAQTSQPASGATANHTGDGQSAKGIERTATTSSASSASQPNDTHSPQILEAGKTTLVQATDHPHVNLNPETATGSGKSTSMSTAPASQSTPAPASHPTPSPATVRESRPDVGGSRGGGGGSVGATGGGKSGGVLDHTGIDAKDVKGSTAANTG
jgi:hypothetical protein